MRATRTQNITISCSDLVPRGLPLTRRLEAGLPCGHRTGSQDHQVSISILAGFKKVITRSNVLLFPSWTPLTVHSKLSSSPLLSRPPSFAMPERAPIMGERSGASRSPLTAPSNPNDSPYAFPSRSLGYTSSGASTPAGSGSFTAPYMRGSLASYPASVVRAL